MAEKSIFQTLYDINVNDKVKQKNGLNYISWADSLAEIKKVCPDATYKVYEQVIDSTDCMIKASRPWFDDGKSGWVKVSVTIDGKENIEYYPIMDFKNKAIPAENITSTDANKAIQRGLTKAAARHGLGLYIYSGEDIPEEEKKEKKKKAEEAKTELEEWNTKCYELAKQASKVDNSATSALCKKYVPNGNPKRITDIESSKDLFEKLQEIIKKGENKNE